MVIPVHLATSDKFILPAIPLGTYSFHDANVSKTEWRNEPKNDK